MTAQSYLDWIQEHLTAAKARYEELCKLDDLEEASGGGANIHYVQAQQMFGYVAALEKCQREARALIKPSAPKPGGRAAAPKLTAKKKTAKR